MRLTVLAAAVAALWANPAMALSVWSVELSANTSGTYKAFTANSAQQTITPVADYYIDVATVIPEFSGAGRLDIRTNGLVVGADLYYDGSEMKATNVTYLNFNHCFAGGGVCYERATTAPTGSIKFSGNGLPPAVPEPATWALMLLGFGAVALAMRQHPRAYGRTT